MVAVVESVMDCMVAYEVHNGIHVENAASLVVLRTIVLKPCPIAGIVRERKCAVDDLVGHDTCVMRCQRTAIDWCGNRGLVVVIWTMLNIARIDSLVAVIADVRDEGGVLLIHERHSVVRSSHVAEMSPAVVSSRNGAAA